jgi:hypothetical protein
MSNTDPPHWAAIIPEPDGSIAVYVHGWILAGKAKNADEFWKLVHEAWFTPEKFWELFYKALDTERGRRYTVREPVDPKLKELSIEDLGL